MMYTLLKHFFIPLFGTSMFGTMVTAADVSSKTNRLSNRWTSCLAITSSESFASRGNKELHVQNNIEEHVNFINLNKDLSDQHEYIHI